MSNSNTIRSVLQQYGLDDERAKVTAFGGGLINHTWKVEQQGKEFILQKINHDVFKQPEAIAHNIRMIADYLKIKYPEYNFVAPIVASNKKDMVTIEADGYYRLFPFITGSHTVDTVQTSSQAYEAARQFGRFTRVLAGFDARKLNITIPRFHDLRHRHQQFLDVLKNGDTTRIEDSTTLSNALISHKNIVDEYDQMCSNPAFKVRVTHHDTKISNVLFNDYDQAVAVIDLDTVMPGYYTSDLGDMMRTYLSPANEEEKDMDKVIVRTEYYHAITQGYFDEMKDELDSTEKQYFFHAGKFMIYMQALRFLTDHLAGDIYYQVKYPGHNYNRAMNQATLLQRFVELEPELRRP